MCTRVWDSYVPLQYLVTCVKCHGIPRLPNHWVCDSLYLLGTYFMAQSCVNNIVSSLTLSSMSERAMSCFTYRNWWALNVFISCLAVSTVNVISSFTSHEGRGTVSTAFSISVMTSLRISQLPQSSSCVCWQLGTESDPNECWKQWSATLDVSSTWTCKEKSEERDYMKF